MKVFLIGYMGSGKSTLGKKLAKALELPFMDLDQLIEAQTGKSISAIFEQEGEAAFRKIEQSVLQEQAKESAFVMALGGGAPCDQGNLELILLEGVVVYLQMEVSALLQRLRQAKTVRPLLSGKSEEELKSFVENQLTERTAFYEQAQLTVSGINLDADRISALVEEIKAIANK